MGASAYELAILLSLKDMASGGLNRVEGEIRSFGKEGKASLKTFQELREDLAKGIAIGGVGVGALKTLMDGVKQAGSFETSMTDLRLAIEEVGSDGSTNMAKLNDQMSRFEALGMKLGDQLPGTTGDFIKMFVALKEGGLATESILGGAAEAAAHLAVLTHEDPAELGKKFAQLGEQFQLKPEEFVPAADKFLRVFRVTALNPEEMIEGSKFLQLRAGLPLGLRGLAGLNAVSDVLALLRQSGLEGGIAGREAAGLLMHLAPTSKEQKKTDAQLKGMGIDLQFFDKKGEFAGVENMLVQVSKLKDLSALQKQEIVKKRFGSAEALGPESVFTAKGVEGYKQLHAKEAAIVGMDAQMGTFMKNYEARMENLTGTLTNLKVTLFTPLMDEIKPFLDSANSVASWAQEMTKAHQAVAGGLTGFAALAAIVTTLTGAWKAGSAAMGLYRIASTALANQTAINNTLQATSGEAAAAGNSLAAATVQGRAFSGMLGTVPKIIGVTILLYGVENAINKLIEYRQAVAEYMGLGKNLDKAGADANMALKYSQKVHREMGVAMPQQAYGTAAQSAFQLLNENRHLEYALAPERMSLSERVFTTSSNPLLGDVHAMLKYSQALRSGAGGAEPPVDTAGADFIKRRAPALANPEVMSAFRDEAKRWNFSPEGLSRLDQMLQTAQPEAFKKATEGQIQDLTALSAALKELPQVFRLAEMSVDEFSGRLRGVNPQSSFLQVGGPRMFGPNQAQPFSFTAPSKASGGFVERGGFVKVHDFESIVPARVTAQWRDPQPLRSTGKPPETHIHFHLPPGSQAANDPRALAKLVGIEIERQRERS